MNFRNFITKVVKLPKSLAIYQLLIFILALAFFVRVYRIGDFLGFWYDQGRDALVIWDLWHNGKFFLIGPVTGLHGIFLGPFYYYLIAPLYLFGSGNPLFPSVFLICLSVVAIYVLFRLVQSMHSTLAAFFAAIVVSFSYYIINVSQWLSNPNPILLTSVLLLGCLWKLIEQEQSADRKEHKKSHLWIAVALLVGISLQLESASAIFYIPMVLIFMVWYYMCDISDANRKPFASIKQILKQVLDNSKVLVVAFGVFLATLLPQIIFNFRHGNLLLTNLKGLVLEERAFRGFTLFDFEMKIKFFWSVIQSKLTPDTLLPSLIAITLVLTTLYVRRKHLKPGLLTLFAIFILMPMVGYTFFQGNYGNLYDYYMSGYYLPIMALFAIGLAELYKTGIGKVLVPVFFIVFLQTNGVLIKNRLQDRLEGPEVISFNNQLEAVDWVITDAADMPFNVDIYVPPVIPYAYDYLFLWQTTSRCGDSLCGLEITNQLPVVYTLYEVDPPHPERLDAWLARQKGIGEVVKEASFAGITVQKRLRI